MNEQDLERVAGEFAAFCVFFAPCFHRRDTRQQGYDYVRALLVQAVERRNAENLAEVEPHSARTIQQFLTESPWDDLRVTLRLQEWLAPRLNHRKGIWVVDESSFAKQGIMSAGVGRQYCGALGKVANCQLGVFLSYVSPLGRALVDKRLYLPHDWTDDPDRCDRARIPVAERAYLTKPQLALSLLSRARDWGLLQADWVTGDDLYGNSPDLRDGLNQAGWQYVLEVPSDFLVWSAQQRRKLSERANALCARDWKPITVGEGAQGKRTYLFAWERLRDNRNKEPGIPITVVYRKNQDGSEPRYYVSNAPTGVPLWELARVAANRWPIETEFETNKSNVGMDEYEVRSFPGWHRHMLMCMLASAFLLSLQQEWGEKDAPDHAATGISTGARDASRPHLLNGRVVGLAKPHPSPQRALQALAHQTKAHAAA